MPSFNKYLQQCGYAKSTIAGYLDYTAQFINWMEDENTKVELCNHRDMIAYIQTLQKRKLQQTSIQKHIGAISHFFQWQIKAGLREENPTENINLQGIKRKSLYHILTAQELEALYHHFEIPPKQHKNQNQNWYRTSQLVAKRNKVIVGLMIWQGLGTQDLGNLSISELKLREGKICVPRTRKSNERELELQANQVLDLMEYTTQTRAELLNITGKQSQKLFVSTGKSERFNPIMVKLLPKLIASNPQVSSPKQIRTSVITHWLKNYNLRKVQYMAGHRYISSTEAYLINDTESLKQDITLFHPIS